MDNIQAINKIVNPHFELNLDDLYGNRGGSGPPNVEELSTLFFKLKAVGRKLCSKEKREELVDKVRELNIGDVELMTIRDFGTYISVELYEGINYVLK